MIQREQRTVCPSSGCGLLALAYLRYVLFGIPLPRNEEEVVELHRELRNNHVMAMSAFTACFRPWHWGSGLQEQMVKEFAALLEQQGVPSDVSEARASAAIKALGAPQVKKALSSKAPWRELKTIGTHARFQFMLPSELAAKIAENAGKGKVRGKKGRKPVAETQPFQLGPAKLVVSPGVFQHKGTALVQLLPSQFGPLAEGIVVMSAQDAEPYVRAGQLLSKCPLALVIVTGGSLESQCSLPNAQVTVPCRCSVNQEPLLVEALLVQLGTGNVEKAQEQSLVKVETTPVCTVKLMVYRDEVQDWETFVQSPLKYVVMRMLPLQMCPAMGCKCGKWHPPATFVAKSVLLDAWRRRYMKAGFRPEKLLEATIFPSVSVFLLSC